MAGTGIWLSDQDLSQTGGTIWAQQQVQSLGTQMKAGQDWANEMIARAQQQAQAQMQSLAQTPVAPTPTQTPTPASVTPAPAPVTPAPAPVPEPAPVAPVPTPTPAPAGPTDLSPFQAGQDWAQQQIQNLLGPQAASQAPPIPGVSPTSTQTPLGGPTATPAPEATPTRSATPSTPGAPAGPQPNAPGDLIDQTRQAATAAGIDPDIFSRQIQQESGFNPNAVSGAGARGIAQFMPGTAQGLGINPDDPAAALPAAANLMKSYLDKYSGDWSKALAAYNAGPGNVDQYGGVPPFEETQRYVKNILGGAQNLVQSAAQTGLSAVNSAVDAVHSAVARVSQFGLGLSSGDAMAFCGPAAALAFAQTFGRNPTVDEAKDLATKVGWDPNQGMAGPQSEVKLLNAMGVDAHMTNGVDWQQVGKDASGGNPVIIDTPGHYYYIDGYNADTGKFHVGTSGTDLKGGSEWMSSDQINAMPQSHGSARAAIYADHPLAQQNGSAQPGSASAQPLTMGTMQPGSNDPLAPYSTSDPYGYNLTGTSSGGGTSLLNQGGNLGQQVLSGAGGLLGGGLDLLGGLGGGVQDKAQQTLQAVQSVGSSATQRAQDLLGGGLDLLSNPNSALSPEDQQFLATHPEIANYLNLGPGQQLSSALDPHAIAALGIDPLAGMQAGLGNITQGIQNRDVLRTLGGTAQTGLTLASALPGESALAAAGTHPLVDQLAGSQMMRDLIGGEAGTLDLSRLAGGGAEDTTRMFHGTSSAFDAAAPGRFAEEGLYGPGYYLTSDPRVAGGTIAQGGEVLNPGMDWSGLSYKPATYKPGDVISQGYAGSAPKFTSADIAQRQDAVTGLQRILQEEPLAPDGQTYIQGLLDQAKARLAEVAGPNVRAIDVPNSLNLLDMDAPVTQDVATRVADQLIQSGPWRYETLDSPEVAARIREWTTGTGNDLYTELAQETGSKGEANQILTDAGFDGIQHEGGQRVPMLDENGEPISHQVNVIFPQALDQITNAISGRQGGQASIAMARLLGGGAAGGYGSYQATDPNDPNRWLKVAAGAGAGALAAGPALDIAIQAPGTIIRASGNTPGAVSMGDWANGVYRGGVISGLNTMADVAGSAWLTPAASLITGTIRDVASLSPSRLTGRWLGAASGMTQWTDNFLAGLSDALSRPGSLSSRAGPGLATLAELPGALHAGFQNATSGLVQSMERGAAAGEAASGGRLPSGTSFGQWVNNFQQNLQNPAAGVAQAAQQAGARAAYQAPLGTWSENMSRFVRGMGPVGDALFPVVNMGMRIGARMAEFSPVGLAGTALDIGKRAIGEGPYAQSFAGNATVGPLSERLTNNAIGTAVSAWLAMKAANGDVTGSGPEDPKQRAVWLADGNQPDSFRAPDGKFYPWDRLPPAISGPMMFAGAYGDALIAQRAAEAKQGAAAPGAYNVEDPRYAAAQQLITEVTRQLISRSPARALAGLYDTFKSGGDAGQAVMSGLANTVSDVAGGAIPASGLVRSVAQMTDPTQRQTLYPTQPQQLPQAILQRVQENIPGARQMGLPSIAGLPAVAGLPASQDILGRQIGNPMQGLGTLSPFHPAAGQPSPILEMMQNVGVAPGAAPPSIPFGPTHEITLTPDERRQWEVYRGNLLQQMATPVVESPQFQQLGNSPFGAQAQKNTLQRLSDQADAYATRMLTADLAPTAPTRWALTGRLAPVVGYGPNLLAGQQQMALQQALMRNLLGGGLA